MLSAVSFRSARLLQSAAIRSASTLILCDPLTHGEAPAATQSAVTAAAQLGSDNSIALLVVGESAPTKVPAGVTKVYHAAASSAVAETIASTLQSTTSASQYDFVVGTSSKFGSTVIPRAAALLGVSPVTDIIEILEPGKCWSAVVVVIENASRFIFMLFNCWLSYWCLCCK